MQNMVSILLNNWINDGFEYLACTLNGTENVSSLHAKQIHSSIRLHYHWWQHEKSKHFSDSNFGWRVFDAVAKMQTEHTIVRLTQAPTGYLVG